MVFQYGKTYQHTTGTTLKIVGVADTHIHGKCLIAEDEYGELIPVGQDESHAQNYIELFKPIKEGLEGKA